MSLSYPNLDSIISLGGPADMFIHLEILFCILTLMLGSWVVYNAFLLSQNTAHKYLKPIAFFILFYNLSILMRLISQYTCANILASCFVFNASIYSKILAPFAFAINVGMTVSMGAVVLTFLGRSVSRRWKMIISGAIVLAVIGYVLRIVLGPQLELLPWLPLFNQVIYLIVVFIAYGFLVYLVVGIRRNGDAVKARVAQSFGFFYLAAYTSLILSFLFQPMMEYFFVIVVHLLFNLFLILWLRYSFLPYYRQSVSAVTDEKILEGFFKEHGISKREMEIAELILVGKSNKEIQHQLYISPHTVKNHIYSLYQKAGVQSRGQLIHLLLGINTHR